MPIEFHQNLWDTSCGVHTSSARPLASPVGSIFPKYARVSLRVRIWHFRWSRQPRECAPAHQLIWSMRARCCHAGHTGDPCSLPPRPWAGISVRYACVFGSYACVFAQKLENLGAGADAGLQLLVSSWVHPGHQLHQFWCSNSVGTGFCAEA